MRVHEGTFTFTAAAAAVVAFSRVEHNEDRLTIHLLFGPLERAEPIARSIAHSRDTTTTMTSAAVAVICVLNLVVSQTAALCIASKKCSISSSCHGLVNARRDV